MFEKHSIIPNLESPARSTETSSDIAEAARRDSSGLETTLPDRISLEDALSCVRDQGLDPVSAMIRAIKKT